MIKRLLLFACAAGAALALGVAVPASAHSAHSARLIASAAGCQDATGRLIESHGSYYIDASSLSYGTAVTEGTGGRSMKWACTGHTWCFQGFCYYTGLLEFTASPDACAHVDTNSYTNVWVNDCTGIAGVDWAEGVCGGHWCFLNVAASEHFGNTKVLSGADKNGNQFDVTDVGTAGAYQEFSWV